MSSLQLKRGEKNSSRNSKPVGIGQIQRAERITETKYGAMRKFKKSVNMLLGLTADAQIYGRQGERSNGVTCHVQALGVGHKQTTSRSTYEIYLHPKSRFFLHWKSEVTGICFHLGKIPR